MPSAVRSSENCSFGILDRVALHHAVGREQFLPDRGLGGINLVETRLRRVVGFGNESVAGGCGPPCVWTLALQHGRICPSKSCVQIVANHMNLSETSTP